MNSSPPTRRAVMIHEDGTVSVGTSGEAGGNAVSMRHAEMLQSALNESAGYNKYTVSVITDENLLVKIPEAVGSGNEPGACVKGCYIMRAKLTSQERYRLEERQRRLQGEEISTAPAWE